MRIVGAERRKKTTRWIKPLLRPAVLLCAEMKAGRRNGRRNRVVVVVVVYGLVMGIMVMMTEFLNLAEVN